MKKVLIAIIIILSTCLTAAVMECKSERQKYSDAMQTVKAYDAQLDSIQVSNKAYKLTMVLLEHSADSVFKELQTIRKQLKIKEKNVLSVQYISSVIHKTDTITLNDTILQPQVQNVDTVIGDDWYKLELKMQYPGTLVLSPNFKSSQYIITHMKKETVDPPKKWWWQRLFQRKQKVLNVEVVERNPYIDVKTNKYVEVIK